MKEETTALNLSKGIFTLAKGKVKMTPLRTLTSGFIAQFDSVLPGLLSLPESSERAFNKFAAVRLPVVVYF